ncbi:Golgin subfamily A member 5 [Armadillidium vulgare]|nr:Golgin subfamily A member 5 [Armadillidium vulgare]
MSWISNLAGKAENVLNKLDSGVASALTKEKSAENFASYDHKRSSFPSSSSVPSNLNEFDNLSVQSVPSTYTEGGSLTTTPKRKGSSKKGKDQEQSFIDFLNDTKKKSDGHHSQGKEGHTSSKDKGHSRQSSVSSGSSFLAVSGRETPGFTALEIDTNSGGSHSSDAYVNVEPTPDPALSSPSSFNSNDSDGGPNSHGVKENHSEVLLLRKEMSSLNQEMAQIIRRAKDAEKESQRHKDQITTNFSCS